MNEDQSIQIVNISRHYSKIQALNQISFTVESGELFGFIGADGAGKTTLFEILATLLTPDEGSVSIGGMDLIKQKSGIRASVGYMPGKFSLYQDLSVRENLDFYATIFGTSLEEGYDLIAPIWNQIKPFSDRPAGKLSGGMKQKLALCCALVHKPVVLLLDEPTTGVDPVSRREFWDMLRSLKEKGITILVSTPYMDEAVKCERIAFLNEGNLLDVKTPDEYIQSYRGTLWCVEALSPYVTLKQLEALSVTESAYMFGRDIHWTVAEKTITDPAEFLSGRGVAFTKVSRIEPVIEDCFMQLMKGGNL